MTALEKLNRLRHDFYTQDELDYDSVSYFAEIGAKLAEEERFEKETGISPSTLMSALRNGIFSDECGFMGHCFVGCVFGNLSIVTDDACFLTEDYGDAWYLASEGAK